MYKEEFEEFYNRFLEENKNNFEEMEKYRQKSIYERKRNTILTIIGDIVFLILTLFIFSLGLNKYVESLRSCLF